MPGPTPENHFVSIIDEHPITLRQKKIVAAAVLADMMEFFDYFLLGFILSIITSTWDLTFGQTAVILLTSGVGFLVGAVLCGYIADRIGRRKVFMWTVVTFSVATGAMALVPEGGWLFLSLLRFVVGCGVGGLYAVDLPLVQEFVPARRRGQLGGLVTMFIPAGLLLGSLSTALLGDTLGWRGLVLIGLLPALLSLYIRKVVPESPRWLMSQGRAEQARESIAWAVELAPEDVELPPAEQTARPRWRELFHYPHALTVSWLTNLTITTAAYGVLFWGPSLLVLTLGITPARAAFLFIFMSVASLAGRALFAYLSERIGRRMSGVLLGTASTPFFIAAAFGSTEPTLWGVSLFYLMMLGAFFFADGGFAIVGPYAAEVWPTRLRASGMGSALGVGSLGRIGGPMLLALIAGSGNLVTPMATTDAITPAFLLFAACTAGAAVVFAVFGIETKGRTIDEIDAGLRRGPRRLATAAPIGSEAVE
ncbi:MFS transporter [Nocardia sp. NBC_00508]|uniref:MFS transporter n=1 Tax=Nocardia sp. NBC_00508 TaxID=2975992 RepID=UPI002E7FE99D|nr:MFS transporter [Nocardia sp. NBC_00508]WUD65957.1 MFS transporter [Nocardia sp. NBC_00508]